LVDDEITQLEASLKDPKRTTTEKELQERLKLIESQLGLEYSDLEKHL